MSRELLLFVKSIWYGALLVLTYDVLKISRNVIRHSSAFVALEDLLFWIFCALFLFARYFQENSGILRGYLGAGVLFGSLACYVSISPYFVRFFTFLFKKILKILRIPLNIVKKVIKRLKSGLFRVKLLLRTKLGGRKKGERLQSHNKGESDEKKKKRRQKKTHKGTQPSE
ncbi:spore cortex biosynthesis protein YabQ [Novisyntrophococcus fermenticellae]|uniref:spore cortex biosynthesis protein YabQ n=1 Tax=Novisyntrophococcus fermenticellae TaxID=2068655 RepID=UPI001E2944AC|nr:spore cortex biosynthesis protein YabQ [Novisyntrophococcus fermenticellae]